jgi:hypothetical protein
MINKLSWFRGIGIAGIMAAAVFAVGVFAAGPSYSIDIDTPVSVSGADVSLTGVASATKFAGQFDQYHIAVDWGDGASGDVSSGLIEAGDDFSGTWSGNHQYSVGGAYTITVMLCHQSCSGAEGADATDSVEIEIVIPSQCNDGIDNDEDDQTDFPNDPGCSSAEDDDETDAEVDSATLTVIKTVMNDSETGTSGASDFTMNVTGATSTSFAGSAEGVELTLTSFGEYSVTEGDHEGYNVSYSEDCSGTIAANDDKVCTVTNDDIPEAGPTTGTIVIIKDVVGADGVSEISDDSAFTVNVGSSSSTFGEGVPAVFVGLEEGEYSISEDGKTGYSLVSVSSTTASVVAGATTTVTIVNKISTECNDGIDNDEDESTDYPNDSGCSSASDSDEGDDESPTTGVIVITKNVLAFDGETDVEDNTSFGVSVGEANGSVSEGSQAVFSNLQPGEYAISETNIPEGYEFVSISATSTTVVAGATTTVALVNKISTDDEDEDSDNGGHKGGRRHSPSSQGQVLGASTSCGIYLDKFLRKGYANDTEQVTKLQSFLAEHLGITLPVNGNFGSETEDAVKKFQVMYGDEILTPWGGLKVPTGIVFRTTARVINNKMCPELNLSIPGHLVPWSADPETAKN